MKIHRADVKSGSRIGTWVYILTEFCEGGNLNQRLNRPSSRATEYKWITQLADALAYLHSRSPPIVHGDLKPENVLLTSNDDIKLADFGLAREYVSIRSGSPIGEQSSITHYTTTEAGTRAFMAPEVFAGNYTLKADVFSLGLIFYAILEKRYIGLGPAPEKYFGAFMDDDGLPFGEALFDGNKSATVPFAKGNGHDIQSLRTIISDALAYDPDDRPTAKMITLVTSMTSRLQPGSGAGPWKVIGLGLCVAAAYVVFR